MANNNNTITTVFTDRLSTKMFLFLVSSALLSMVVLSQEVYTINKYKNNSFSPFLDLTGLLRHRRSATTRLWAEQTLRFCQTKEFRVREKRRGRVRRSRVCVRQTKFVKGHASGGRVDKLQRRRSRRKAGAFRVRQTKQKLCVCLKKTHQQTNITNTFHSFIYWLIVDFFLNIIFVYHCFDVSFFLFLREDCEAEEYNLYY